MTLLRIFTAFFMVMTAIVQAAAQDRRVPASSADVKLSYAPIVQRVQPAVVTVAPEVKEEMSIMMKIA